MAPGTSEAIKSLLSVLGYDKMVFPFTLPEYEEIIKQKFLISAEYMVDFMMLERGGDTSKFNIQPFYSMKTTPSPLPV